MDHRNIWRTRKFYRQQVDSILNLLETTFKADSKKFEEYLAVCEKLGKTPDLNKIPIEISAFPYEVQIALTITELLPDRWDGASGSYLGKDWSSTDLLLNTYEVEDTKTTIFFIRCIDSLRQKLINEDLNKERKAEEKRAQGKDMRNMNFPKGTT